jgi:hypothetical protein
VNYNENIRGFDTVPPALNLMRAKKTEMTMSDMAEQCGSLPFITVTFISSFDSSHPLGIGLDSGRYCLNYLDLSRLFNLKMMLVALRRFLFLFFFGPATFFSQNSLDSFGN